MAVCLCGEYVVPAIARRSASVKSTGFADRGRYERKASGAGLLASLQLKRLLGEGGGVAN